MSCNTLPPPVPSVDAPELPSATAYNCISGDVTACDQAVGRSAVRLKAQQAARELNAATAQLAAALLSVKRDGGWKDDFPTLTEYLAEELQLSPRAAGELIRVAERLEQADVPLAAGEQVGFHKLTLVHKQLNSENKDSLLQDAHALAASALKQRYQPPRPAPRSTNNAPASSGVETTAAVTPVSQPVAPEPVARELDTYQGNDALLVQALLRASEITGSLNHCANLDFIASEFLRTHSAPARRDTASRPATASTQATAANGDSQQSAYRPKGGTLSPHARHVLGGKGTLKISSGLPNRTGRH